MIAAADTDLLGARLISIDGRTTDQLLAALSSVIPHENSQWVLAQAGPDLSRPLLLSALGLVDRPDRATFVFDARDGHVERSLGAVASQQAPKAAIERLPCVPSFVFPPSEVFTTRLLPDTHVLVAQYEMCQDSAELSTFIADSTITSLRTGWTNW